ncbi:uncharacterized protein ACLA_073000 [Aspergillus clavatus NRRL 1]|uniref:Uncharacterized protein n=1 Tax=Aspergillus clavatus (strain ATCC 1007 / CBS 513.65 / DSM 816 / NCTC 3887 / NRRL 1 / QM 1276 / 107) TaxID=344612 RepID=A1C794_ASPCL|nr:uncharacterized protein ACLA_073000 [Aspergillus clavatus NRRL 1]EAW14265.1 hypothetical protein ACLA_073000 [Aspergillus clavatus NRRL 1]
MDTLSFKERVHQCRRNRQPLTDEEIAYITQESAELAGAASDQIQWMSKAEQVLSKPASEITMDDARNITSKEVSVAYG